MRYILTFLMLLSTQAAAQQAPTTADLNHQLQPFRAGGQLSGPQSLQQYVADGKMCLGLHDTVQLMLLNNTKSGSIN